MRVSAKMPPAPSSYELLPRSSSDLDSSTSILEDESFIKDKPRRRGHRRQLSRFVRRARRICRFCRPLYVFVAFVVFIIWQLLFNASYANPPAFSIPEGETVFLAANIIDGGLITGAWGKSVVDFVELIGKERVFVSIYGGPTEALKKLETMLPCEKKLVSEDQHPLDLGAIPRTKLPTGESRIKRIAYLAEVRNKALEPLDEMKGRRFDKVLFINDVFFDAKDAARLLWGTNLNKDGESVYKAACGVDFVKWWKFYDTFATRDAEGYSLGIPIFPWFANVGEARSRKDLLEGRDNVRVKSCWGGMTAFDGRYFQKQVEGMQLAPGHLGMPGKEKGLPGLPLRFRSEPEPFWDASECCLIHADIMALPDFPTSPALPPPSTDPASPKEEKDPFDSSIYMNPYVRVAYDARTHSLLGFGRRFERLYTLPQGIINRLAHMPHFNARREEVEGQVIKDKIWVSTVNSIGSTSTSTTSTLPFEEGNMEREFGSEESTWQGVFSMRVRRDTIGSGGMGKEYWSKKGHYVDTERKATRGAYCGARQLLVVKEGKLEQGEKNWDNLLDEVPPLEM